MNHLTLLETPPSKGLTHGGYFIRRNFSVYINGVLVRRLQEDSAHSYWATGESFDKQIATYIRLLESALRCKCVRGRIKEKP